MISPTLPVSRRGLLGTSIVLIAGAALAGCTSEKVLSTTEAITAEDLTAAALPLVNRAREAKGLPLLKADPVAAGAARDQAIRMARFQRMNHYLGSESFFARMKRNGVAMPAAENIAMAQQSVEQAVIAWIKSPRHYENMIGRYSGLGVAVARNADLGGRPFWAMVLSNPDRDQGRMQW